MTDQPDLFNVGERAPPERPRVTCTPDAIGTGPEAETCGSCRWIHRSPGGRFRKCELMRSKWTHGTGTDIKSGWPSCSKWAAVVTFKEYADGQLKAMANALDLPKEVLEGEKPGDNLATQASETP